MHTPTPEVEVVDRPTLMPSLTLLLAHILILVLPLVHILVLVLVLTLVQNHIRIPVPILTLVLAPTRVLIPTHAPPHPIITPTPIVTTTTIVPITTIPELRIAIETTPIMVLLHDTTATMTSTTAMTPTTTGPSTTDMIVTRSIRLVTVQETITAILVQNMTLVVATITSRSTLHAAVLLLNEIHNQRSCLSNPQKSSKEHSRSKRKNNKLLNLLILC